MRLSVIIPTHNRCALLREAIISVTQQSISCSEVIVCDDGSTEDMSAVYEQLPTRENMVIWSRTEACQGAQVARNRGLALARGEAVMFLDSDDVLTNDGVITLLQALECDQTVDYVWGKVIRTDGQLIPLYAISPVGRPCLNYPVDAAGYDWHTMGAVYRKSYLEKVGRWNESLTGSQDWEYQARVKLAGGHGQFIDTVVGYWREHGGSRVGTKVFRPDYVRSVMLACDSILQLARKAGRCDSKLERKLANKLIVHAVEWGASGYRKEKKRCLKQAVSTTSGDLMVRIAALGLALCPAALDRIFIKRIYGD